ncbi:MAG: transcriptional regulator HexR, partial [bacterium]
MQAASNNLLNLIAESLTQLSKSETKVANKVLENPALVTQSTIATLAQAAEVSEPTVNRFCKKFGADGYPDFKLKLAHCIGSGVKYLSQSVE